MGKQKKDKPKKPPVTTQTEENPKPPVVKPPGS